jgi:hypothetical protein
LERVIGFPIGSPAQWIWSADNDADDIVYFRYTITVGEVPLAVDTTSLPNAIVGQPYSQTLSASGGIPPYIWSVVAGNLPAGLSLDPASGEISGIPTVAGINNFTVQVQDDVGDIATAPLSITVDPAPSAQLDLTISTDNVDEVYLNGALLGGSSDWQQASNYSMALQNGINVIAVKGTDVGGPGGLIAEITWNGSSAYSDSSWKVSTVFQAGWEQIGFDDSGWSAATTYGAYGVGPWLERVIGFPTGSPAQWIWSADNDADNLVYFRYTITVP